MATENYIAVNQEVLFKGKFYKDLTTANDVYIKWKNPNGDTGQWTGAKLQVGADWFITYLTGNDDLNVPGDWTFWGFADYPASVGIPGKPAIIHVYREGELPTKEVII